MPDPVRQRVGDTRRAVLDQFDAHHVATLPDVSDMRQLGERAEQSAEGGDSCLHPSQCAFSPEHCQVRQSHRAADRVPSIAMTVKERGPLLMRSQEGPVDLLGRQRGSQRKIPPGQSLADGHQIRRDPFVVAGEHPSCSPESGCHFIRNQQHVVPAAEVTDAREVAGRGGQHAGGGLDERFDDQSGDLPMPLLQHVFDRFEARDRAGRVR